MNIYFDYTWLFLTFPQAFCISAASYKLQKILDIMF